MEETSLHIEEIQRAFWAAVKKTINKFREHPYYFFTESDITSYFYYCLYKSRFEVRDATKRRIYLVHREYPTNFRYGKKELLNEKFKLYPLDSKEGSRGNYDLALLNPDFVKTAETVEDVVNKDIRLLLKRIGKQSSNKCKELLFSVEFKYVINNNENFVKEIKMDNKKLFFSEENQSKSGINLVFCNKRKPAVHLQRMHGAVRESNVITIFIHSYYDTDNKKITPKPIANSKLENYITANQNLFENHFWHSIDIL